MYPYLPTFLEPLYMVGLTLNTFLLYSYSQKKAKVDFDYSTMGCINKCYEAVEIVCFKAMGLSFVILR